jgi:hypothetical protein
MSDVPLIYTTKGNLPVADLKYRHEWAEDGDSISLVEEYFLGDELVRRNVHMRLKKGLETLFATATS